MVQMSVGAVDALNSTKSMPRAGSAREDSKPAGHMSEEASEQAWQRYKAHLRVTSEEAADLSRGAKKARSWLLHRLSGTSNVTVQHMVLEAMYKTIMNSSRTREQMWLDKMFAGPPVAEDYVAKFGNGTTAKAEMQEEEWKINPDRYTADYTRMNSMAIGVSLWYKPDFKLRFPNFVGLDLPMYFIICMAPAGCKDTHNNVALQYTTRFCGGVSAAWTFDWSGENYAKPKLVLYASDWKEMSTTTAFIEVTALFEQPDFHLQLGAIMTTNHAKWAAGLKISPTTRFLREAGLDLYRTVENYAKVGWEKLKEQALAAKDYAWTLVEKGKDKLSRMTDWVDKRTANARQQVGRALQKISGKVEDFATRATVYADLQIKNAGESVMNTYEQTVENLMAAYEAYPELLEQLQEKAAELTERAKTKIKAAQAAAVKQISVASDKATEASVKVLKGLSGIKSGIKDKMSPITDKMSDKMSGIKNKMTGITRKKPENEERSELVSKIKEMEDEDTYYNPEERDALEKEMKEEYEKTITEYMKRVDLHLEESDTAPSDKKAVREAMRAAFENNPKTSFRTFKVANDKRAKDVEELKEKVDAIDAKRQKEYDSYWDRKGANILNDIKVNTMLGRWMKKAVQVPGDTIGKYPKKIKDAAFSALDAMEKKAFDGLKDVGSNLAAWTAEKASSLGDYTSQFAAFTSESFARGKQFLQEILWDAQGVLKAWKSVAADTAQWADQQLLKYVGPFVKNYTKKRNDMNDAVMGLFPLDLPTGGGQVWCTALEFGPSEEPAT